MVAGTGGPEDGDGAAYRFGLGVERVPEGGHPFGDVAERGARRRALNGRLSVAKEQRVRGHRPVRKHVTRIVLHRFRFQIQVNNGLRVGKNDSKMCQKHSK